MSGVAVFLLIYFGLLIWASIVAVQKGKTTMMILGWVLCTPLIVIAAIRIAKPNSGWATRKYKQVDPMKWHVSVSRFPKEAYVLEQLELAHSA